MYDISNFEIYMKKSIATKADVPWPNVLLNQS